MKNIFQGTASGLFHTFESIANGTIFTLLILNLINIACFLMAIFYPDISRIFAGAGLFFFITAIVSGCILLKILKKGQNDTTNEILQLFSIHDMYGRADLSKVAQNFAHPEVKKISEKYEIFLATIRTLIDTVRALDIDIAISIDDPLS